MTTHADHRFSITIETDDLALVGCLRALAKFSQKTGNNQIPWGGTKDVEWRRAGNLVTFRFSSLEYRATFLREIERLILPKLWRVISQRDDDPASPQKR